MSSIINCWISAVEVDGRSASRAFLARGGGEESPDSKGQGASA